MWTRYPTRWGMAVVLLTALTVAPGCRGKQEADEGAVVTVDFAPVLNAQIQRTVRADAVVYPLQQAAIVPKVPGPIKRVLVERGAKVRAGQVLVELENLDLSGSALEAEANYQQAEAQYQTAANATVPEESQKAELELKAAKDSLDAQQAVFDNRQRLLKEGAIAQKDVNEAQVNATLARNQFEIAKKRLDNLKSFAHEAALKAAAAQRDAARGRRDAAAAQLGYTRITSPITGIVTDRAFYPGETPPGGTPVVTVMDLSRVVARAHIAQREAAELKLGGEASLIGPDGSPVPGKVVQVSPALDAGSTTVEVWVEAANADGRFQAGASVRVEMIARAISEALVIPESAVLTSTSGATAVIVIDPDNKPHKETVILGIHDNGRVQVTSGLKNGERVVTTGAFELGKLEEDVLAKTKVKIQVPKEEDEP